MAEKKRDDLLDVLVDSIPSFDEKERAVFHEDLKNMPQDDTQKLLTYVARVKKIADMVSKKHQKPHYAWVAAAIHFYDDITSNSNNNPAPADFYMDIFMSLLDRGVQVGNAFRYTNKAYNAVCDDPGLIKDGKYPTLDDFFPRRDR